MDLTKLSCHVIHAHLRADLVVIFLGFVYRAVMSNSNGEIQSGRNITQAPIRHMRNRIESSWMHGQIGFNYCQARA